MAWFDVAFNLFARRTGTSTPEQVDKTADARNALHVQTELTQPLTQAQLATAGLATQATLASVLGQLDITLSALRDALKGGKTLGDIWTSLQTQREISTSLWTDNSGAVYVRRDTIDESTGTVTVTFTDATGAPAIPGAGLRPLASADKEVVESQYTVITAGTGYAVGGIVARVLVIDTSINPPGMVSTWMNVTAGTIIAAPNPAHLDQYVGLTDQELRASPVTVSSAQLPAALHVDGGMKAAVMNQLLTRAFDYVAIGYNANDDVTSMAFKQGGAAGATVMTLTFTLGGADGDRVDAITRT